MSRGWGFDRGRPIDRHYIEGFLERSTEDIRGHVLEVGDSTYARRFGDEKVERIDVLHVEAGHADVTIVGDLTSASHIPDDTFDCVILTQTLQLIFDVPAAVNTLHRILKSGGVLLATIPGITHTGDSKWQDSWHWSFTTTSTRRLFFDVFGSEHVTIESHGNVLAAVAFLHGLADTELTAEELNHHDPAYDVSITVRAVKRNPTRA